MLMQRLLACATLALIVACGEEPVQGAAAPPPEPAGIPAGVRTKDRLRFALSDAGGFTKKRKPRPGEWLASFKEPGQSLAEYRRSRPVRARPGQEMLAFQPFGDFSATQRAAVDATIEFAGVWFDLETRTLETLPLPGADWSRQRSFAWADEPVIQ